MDNYDKISTNENPQAGISYDERDSILTPLTVRTKENWPLYHVFLSLDDEGVVDPHEAQEAKERLNSIIDKNPNAVLSCEGKSASEALRILKEIENSGSEEAAA